MRGLFPGAGIYIPLQAARQWILDHRGPMSQVALALARESGALSSSGVEGYDSAVVRVTNPVALTDVRKRLTEIGFGSFSIVDQLDQIRTVFLIIDSVLGLLGGISLLVASFGIANTMIMSILERTREIGIMKAIGAEDREIKLIFFVEAAVLGLTGGVIGTLFAWGIDAVANRAAYRFLLKPQGASFIDFFSLPPFLWLGAILFALIVSILAALYPATRAARIDPVKALRHD
jgi:putative ABC transport system permease protein